MPRLPLFLALCGARAVSSWAAAPRGVGAAAHRSARPIMAGWMDYLKFGGSTPSFDVLAKTREYTSTPGYRAFRLRDIPTDYYADDYVFRGPIVGPFNRDDLVSTNLAFGLDSAFPDLERSAFGFTVDPENPYRVLFFERWKGTNSGPIAISQASLPTTPCTLHAVHPAPCTLRPARSSLLAPRSSPTHHSPRATSLHQLPELPPTGRTSESPVFPFSVVWNPEGRIVYEHLTTAVDRFEGNTKGKVAVFGLLETAGLPLDNTVGNPLLVFQQKLNRWTNGAAQTYSRPGDVPAWWKSAAVGAEQNDM